MGKKEIIKELRNILKVYHYNSDGYMAHISKDVVTKLENLLGQLLEEPPKQLEFPFPEKTIQDPTPPEMDSYFGGHLGMKKEVIEDGIVAFTLDSKKL
tara:strand:+ start:190 stop:483 length:294 start_codon:yes stop_codon:yes gene_type:complete